MRAALLRHIEADNGDEPKDYCDKHGGYVDEGRTQPMGPRSPYRICDGCLDESRRRVEASRTYCPECSYLVGFHVNGRCPQELGPTGARMSGGDR